MIFDSGNKLIGKEFLNCKIIKMDKLKQYVKSQKLPELPFPEHINIFNSDSE